MTTKNFTQTILDHTKTEEGTLADRYTYAVAQALTLPRYYNGSIAFHDLCFDVAIGGYASGDGRPDRWGDDCRPRIGVHVTDVWDQVWIKPSNAPANQWTQVGNREAGRHTLAALFLPAFHRAASKDA